MNTERHKFLQKFEHPLVDGAEIHSNLRAQEMRLALNKFMKSRGMHVGRWGSSRDNGREHGREN